VSVSSKTVDILIVEDNRVDADIIRYALEELKDWATDLHFVEDGEEAFLFLEKAGRFAKVDTPDLVLLDLNLPKRSGIEVLQLIKSTTSLRGVKVIVLSSSPVDVIEHLVSDLRMKPNCYFTKPLGLDEFLALGKEIRRCYYETQWNS
jgi:two-component system, chemotaxis family, response regulator Rcp1